MQRTIMLMAAALAVAAPAAARGPLGGYVVPDPWAVERIVLKTPESVAAERILPTGRHWTSRPDERPAEVQLREIERRLLQSLGQVLDGAAREDN